MKKLNELVSSESFIKDNDVNISTVSNGSSALLDEIAVGKGTGEENWWTHHDQVTSEQQKELSDQINALREPLSKLTVTVLGICMLRRAYNYVDGSDEQGRLAAGLFFIAHVKEPARFAKVHRNMARDDMFVEYLKTLGSGAYLVPPGAPRAVSSGGAVRLRASAPGRVR